MPSAAAVTGDRRVGEAGDDGVDLVVGADGVVVEQEHGLGSGQLRQAHRVVDRRVAPRHPRRAAPRRCAGRRGSAGRHRAARASAVSWYGPQPSGPGPERGRAVVGEVRDRRAPVGDAVAEGAAALVRDLEGQHLEAAGVVLTRVEALEASTRPRRPSGPIGKWGGDMARRSTSMAVSPSSWFGMHTRTSAPSLSTARENGRPCVWSQCRWPSSSAPRKGRSPSSAPRPRRPVPASSTRLGAAPSRASATHDVLPPWRAKACPGAGVEPRTPSTWTFTSGVAPLDDGPR